MGPSQAGEGEKREHLVSARRPADAAADAALLSGAPGVGRIAWLMNRGCTRYSCLEHDPFLVKIPEVPLIGESPPLAHSLRDGRARDRSMRRRGVLVFPANLLTFPSSFGIRPGTSLHTERASTTTS